MLAKAPVHHFSGNNVSIYNQLIPARGGPCATSILRDGWKTMSSGLPSEEVFSQTSEGILDG
jgi:hypothetical protein